MGMRSGECFQELGACFSFVQSCGIIVFWAKTSGRRLIFKSSVLDFSRICGRVLGGHSGGHVM